MFCPIRRVQQADFLLLYCALRAPHWWKKKNKEI
jgi:hypothetical protein